MIKGDINNARLTKRNSNISWIKDRNICQRVFAIMKSKVADFSSLHIDNIEPLQYSEYETNQEYGWHQDFQYPISRW